MNSMLTSNILSSRQAFNLLIKGFYLFQVHWKLSGDSDTTADFLTTGGFVEILDKERTSQIVIALLPDDVPEIDENYIVQLTSVEGGADLDHEKSTSRFTVFANDDPYGVFALYPEKQSVLVEEDLNRHIQINITRHAGTFGDVLVEYQISFPSEEQLISSANAVGHLLVKTGSSYGVKTVPIDPQVCNFLSACKALAVLYCLI